MRDEQHWYRQLDGNPQHKTYVSTTPLPGVLDTIHQVSQVSKYPHSDKIVKGTYGSVAPDPYQNVTDPEHCFFCL